jgi:adenosylcobinamide-phosphate synthase
VALALTDVVAAHPIVLVVAVAADLVIGDPVYRLHPVRLIGGALTAIESALRRAGADGYGGGIALFVLLAGVSLAASVGLVAGASLAGGTVAAWAVHGFLLYSLLALGDLLRHVWRVEQGASESLAAGRTAIAHLVGRDTDRMDAAACRRAAVESLSENLTDGFTSAVLWYAVGGLPGLVLFKVVSTMDSMVGYKTERYLRFGWCGARLDDVMNFVPARLTWLLLTIVSLVIPGCSARKAWRVGLSQHAVLLGPNSGWSEAATAGGVQRRLVGPIWLRGQLVTDVWIGDPGDPPLTTRQDLLRSMVLVTVTGLLTVALAGLLLALATWTS